MAHMHHIRGPHIHNKYLFKNPPHPWNEFKNKNKIHPHEWQLQGTSQALLIASSPTCFSGAVRLSSSPTFSSSFLSLLVLKLDHKALHYPQVIRNRQHGGFHCPGPLSDSLCDPSLRATTIHVRIEKEVRDSPWLPLIPSLTSCEWW